MGQLGRTQKSQAASEKKLKAYACELEQKLEARTRELAESRGHLSEALERQAATSEILTIISTSPTELQSVLEAVARSAAHFCKADDVTIFELDGQDLRATAHWVRFHKLSAFESPACTGTWQLVPFSSASMFKYSTSRPR
jgi:hypothetical protein